MKDYNDYANYSKRRNPSFREPYEEPNKTLGNGEIHAVLQAMTRFYRRNQIRPQHSDCGHPYQPYRIPKPRLTPIPENSGPLIFPYFRLSFLQEIWGSGNHRKENR